MEFRDLTELGFPGYRVGDDGSVWSWKCVSGTKNKRWKQLNPWRVKGGYRVIRLTSADKNRVCWLLHRLVLEAFVGVCPEGMEGCHQDDNPDNNQLINLRWDTPQANCADRARAGRHQANTKRGDEHGMARLTSDVVQEIQKLYATEQYSSRELGEMFGISKTNILDVVHERIWSHV